jgi:hypothetical protein
MHTDTRSTAWALLGAAAALAAALAHAPVLAQSPSGTAQGSVRVQVFTDQRRVAAAKKKIGDDGTFVVYGYRLQPGERALELRIDSDEFMQRWKGNAVLGQGNPTFEDTLQFLPVLLVVDVTNESGAPAQVTNAYLEVQDSATERQPFIELSAWGSETFDLRNYGWGRAENARLSFAFGRERPATETFSLALGNLGAVEVTAVRAMAAVVPAVPRLQDQRPRCPSTQQVRRCLAQLQRTAPLGRLDEIAYLRDNQVLTRLIGSLSYQWRDNAGNVQQREHPLNVELRLFEFDTGEQAEMGAAGPEEGGFRPITLKTDGTSYRLPLPYRPRLAPGQNQRFELTLNAPKASRHRWRVVMELSDGSRMATAPLDLMVFVPQMDNEPARQIR